LAVLVPPRSAMSIYAPSRLHELDLAGHWLEPNSDVWEYLRLPE